MIRARLLVHVLVRDKFLCACSILWKVLESSFKNKFSRLALPVRIHRKWKTFRKKSCFTACFTATRKQHMCSKQQQRKQHTTHTANMTILICMFVCCVLFACVLFACCCEKKVQLYTKCFSFPKMENVFRLKPCQAAAKLVCKTLCFLRELSIS